MSYHYSQEEYERLQTEIDELRSQKAALEARLDVMTKIAAAQREISEALETQLAEARKRNAEAYSLTTAALAEPPDTGSKTLIEIATALEGDAAGAESAKPEAVKPE